jgi:outer membrane phospholipase A
VRYGRRDGWLFAAILRKGNGDRGSVQLDASYPIRQPFFANAGGYLHFQYFNGYGETLLNYNERNPSQFRIGFSIVR